MAVLKNSILACSNILCEAYKNEKCKRAIEHKEKAVIWSIDKYVPKRSNTQICELYINN